MERRLRCCGGVGFVVWEASSCGLGLINHGLGMRVGTDLGLVFRGVE